MTRFIQLYVVFQVHVYFCFAYYFGVTSQSFGGTKIDYLFGDEGVLFVLYISGISILCMVLVFSLPITLKFAPTMISKHRLQSGLLIWVLPLTVFMTYIIVISGANYGVMATSRERYSFIVELRVIPYLLMIRYFANYRFRLDMIGLLSIFCILVALMYQARSILFEIIIIFICIRFRATHDRFRWYFIPLSFLAIPLSNIFVAIRNKLTLTEYLDMLWKFEYLILFNNIVAAAQNYEMDNRFYWLLERLSLLLPSPLRSIFGIENPSNELFIEVSNLAGVFSGGFSYLANLYLLFGNYFIVALLCLYLLVEVLRKNFMIYRVDNYLSYAYPVVLSYIILAIRNDFGVLFKQLVQIIIIAMIMNLVSRCIIKCRSM